MIEAYGNCIGGVDAIMGSERRGLAAALRALADQVVPIREEPELELRGSRTASTAWQRWDQKVMMRDEILAIANELNSLGRQPPA